MKLCFSTRGWHGYSWEDFRRMALEYGFSGIEIHNIRDGGLSGESGPVGRSAARATSRGLFEEGLSPDSLRRLCVELMAVCGGRCAVFSGSDEDGYAYALGLENGDLRAFVQDMNTALNGRGGGKPIFAQGRVAAKRAEIEAFWHRP